MSAVFPGPSCNVGQQQKEDDGGSRCSHKSLSQCESSASAGSEVPSVDVAPPEECPSRDSATIRDTRRRVGKQFLAAAAHIMVNERLPETVTHQASYLTQRLALVRAVVSRQVVQESRRERQHIPAVTA